MSRFWDLIADRACQSRMRDAALESYDTPTDGHACTTADCPRRVLCAILRPCGLTVVLEHAFRDVFPLQSLRSVRVSLRRYWAQ
jgi:hypothetical protein